VMAVSEEERTWPEAWLRVRVWHDLEEALSLLDAHPVSSLFERVRERIAEGQV
jgi:hypothetical protein